LRCPPSPIKFELVVATGTALGRVVDVWLEHEDFLESCWSRTSLRREGQLGEKAVDCFVSRAANRPFAATP
jgi:hypothetical protein